jgi:hypothetical protein
MNKKLHIILAFCAFFFCAKEVFGQNTDLDSSDCAQLQSAVHIIAQGGDYQKMYDSAKYTIEHCATQNLFPPIRTDFGVATSGLQYLSNDPNRWPPYREWLKKVLYLNMDTGYYCSDVVSIISTMQYFDANRGNDQNGTLAIIKFLIDSNRCTSFFPSDFNTLWKNIRNEQYTNWRDTSKNPKLNPLDTTVPSLEDLDLQILRGPQYAAVKDAFTPSAVTKIKYLNISDNPFKDETTLRFVFADAEYMRVDIYDLLGNKVYSDSRLFRAGDEEWRIDGKAIAGGSLYARLSTMGGEVKTVKLIHEK